MKIDVESNPTITEIEEMLGFVGMSYDLDAILPHIVGYTKAEFLHAGWCYLWYDSDTGAPLGYTQFSFHRRIFKNRIATPEFSFGTTKFCELRHILKIRRAMLAIMRNAFKNRVEVYIDQERIAKFASANGFKASRRKNIWVKEP